MQRAFAYFSRHQIRPPHGQYRHVSNDARHDREQDSLAGRRGGSKRPLWLVSSRSSCSQASARGMLQPLTRAATGFVGFSAMVPPMMMRAMHDERVAVLPVVLPVTAGGVGIARSEILAIGIRIELGAVAGIFDNGLCHRRCRGRRGEERGGADQCEFHLGLLQWCKDKMGARVNSANGLFASLFRS